MHLAILEAISTLSVEEKILLAERIWDDIAQSATQQSLPISPALKAELERRLQLIKDSKADYDDWKEIEARLLSKDTLL